MGAAVFSLVGEPFLATGCNGPALRFWDPRTAKEIPINDAPSHAAQMVFWLPEGKVLAVYPAEKGYRLWDGRSGKQLAKVSTGDKYIWWAVASPDGKFLAVSSWRGQPGDDKATHLFDLRTGKEIPRLGLKEFMGSMPIRFTSDGRFLIASEVAQRSDGTIRQESFGDVGPGHGQGRPYAGPGPGLEEKRNSKAVGNRSVVSADGKSLVLEMAVRIPAPPDSEDKGFSINHEYYWCSVDLTTGIAQRRTAQVKETDAAGDLPRWETCRVRHARKSPASQW